MSETDSPYEHLGEKTQRKEANQPLNSELDTSAYLGNSTNQRQANVQVLKPQITCETCGKTFNSKIELEMHKETQHKQRETTKKSKKPANREINKT